ncbi:MAG: amino acid adenylation domain-containing protein [Acidimicrobiia bacterium]|nr:amino acid adenylation domain-containing protein [Acidimicrobiia bacterium]
MDDRYIFDLGSAFRAVARRNGSGVALRYPSGTAMTYGELDRRSNQVGSALHELGVRRHDVVCILSNKSPNAFAALLGALKIGAIYTNLDVSSPWIRLEKILGRCEPRIVLYDEAGPELLAQLSDSGYTPVELGGDELTSLVEQQPDHAPCVAAVTASDPAYLMFTSGSTGFPKGAVMSHGNVLNFIRWGQTTFDVTTDDVFTNVNPVYFDNSVFDVYVGLFSGATVCPINAEALDGPRAIVDAVNSLECTIWFSVPSFLVYLLTTRALEATDFGDIRCIVFGGEGFPKPRLAELHDLFARRARLVNVYGPTECTCICSSYDIGPHDLEDLDALAPLGELAPNFGHRIEPIDDADPDFGELWLSGPNVGLGYYNDPERTSQSFVPHPDQGKYRTIMYRTGDLVRRDADGRLHFKGRADNQIKHMGYRIELEEIEAGLNTLPYVRQAAVVYDRGAGPVGRIIGFVDSDGDRSQRDILADLAEVLPPYMLPNKVRNVGSLPKNRNGKVDRTQLLELT